MDSGGDDVLRFDWGRHHREAAPPERQSRLARWWRSAAAWPRWVRVLIAVLLVGAIAAWAVKLTLEGRPPAGALMTIPITFLTWRYDRVATLVSSEGVVVRRMWGQEQVPDYGVTGVEDPGRWGTTVRLHRRDGEPLVLPWVEPPDVPTIRERLATGAPPQPPT